MEEIPQHLVEVGQWFEEGYKPVIDTEGWRVAVLRHITTVDPSTFQQVERHRETDEVFILSSGRADLIVFDGNETPQAPHVFPMMLNVAYNIRRSVWHHVVMTRDAHIILFERSNTGRDNSDYFQFDDATIQAIKAHFTV